MEKIAFSVIRYGADVNGGAEVHCRMLAERLASEYEVEVLTTTIRYFDRPEADYPEGVSHENGVTIRRFKPQPAPPQSVWMFRKIRHIRCLFKKIGLLRLLSSLHPHWTTARRQAIISCEMQPTHTPALLDYIQARQGEYKAFLFLNFYFSQSVLGCKIVPRKSIAIPLAHDEKVLCNPELATLLTKVHHIAFNTRAEMQLCKRIFGNSLAPYILVGCGIEEAPPADWETTRQKYHLPEKYLLYVGRLNPQKLNRIIPDFIRYKQYHGGSVKLVLVGGYEVRSVEVSNSDILLTGFVSDAEKSAIIHHAFAMVNPSHLESLSLLALEAMQNRIPLLVNGKCRVLKEHCKLSGAALWYNNSRDFVRKLHRLLTDTALRETMQSRGPQYVAKNYDWRVILGKLRTIIDSVE